MVGLVATYTISIHAPTRGATIYIRVRNLVCRFQSTLPRGERRIHQSGIFVNRQISIHAPTRGATLRWTSPLARKQFQSTLPRGERRAIHFIQWVYEQFQSTLPRGERLYNQCMVHFHFFISIHAPTRGATGAWKRVSK